MKNITISMPEDLARKVRILAAKADTSMSQYLCQLAAEKAAADDSYASAMERYLSRNRVGISLADQKIPTREEIHDDDRPSLASPPPPVSAGLLLRPFSTRAEMLDGFLDQSFPSET